MWKTESLPVFRALIAPFNVLRKKVFNLKKENVKALSLLYLVLIILKHQPTCVNLFQSLPLSSSFYQRCPRPFADNTLAVLKSKTHTRLNLSNNLQQTTNLSTHSNRRQLRQSILNLSNNLQRTTNLSTHSNFVKNYIVKHWYRL